MSESEVLFKITKEHLDTGLRGFPVGTCPNSHVDPMTGLFYGGYAIADLAEKQPEEVIYLLLKRELPDAAQLSTFKMDIIANSRLDKGVIEHLRTLPKHGHPMKWLLAALNAMGM